MKTIKILERLERLHKLIKNEDTGTPKELATLMHVSERSIHLLLDNLKDYRADIRYSRSRKTYYYNEDFNLEVSISVKVMTRDEVIRVVGGRMNTNTNVSFYKFLVRPT